MEEVSCSVPWLLTDNSLSIDPNKLLQNCSPTITVTNVILFWNIPCGHLHLQGCNITRPKYKITRPKYKTARPKYELARPENELARLENESRRVSNYGRLCHTSLGPRPANNGWITSPLRERQCKCLEPYITATRKTMQMSGAETATAVM